MPIRSFWALNKMLDRIRAEEVLSTIPAFSTSMGGEHVPKVVADLEAVVGVPMVTEMLTMPVASKSRLSRLFGNK